MKNEAERLICQLCQYLDQQLMKYYQILIVFNEIYKKDGNFRRRRRRLKSHVTVAPACAGSQSR